MLGCGGVQGPRCCVLVTSIASRGPSCDIKASQRQRVRAHTTHTHIHSTRTSSMGHGPVGHDPSHHQRPPPPAAHDSSVPEMPPGRLHHTSGIDDDAH